MSKRKSISKRVRFNVFKRDSFTCQYCGRKPPAVVLNIDHILAVASGGDDEETNIVTSCEDCNSGKSDKPLDSTPLPIGDMIEERREKIAQLEAYNEMLAEQREVEDEHVRCLGVRWFQSFIDDGKTYVFGSGRIPSVRTFLRRLPFHEVNDALEIALSRKPPYGRNDGQTWKYFCGVCWKKIRAAEEGRS